MSAAARNLPKTLRWVLGSSNFHMDLMRLLGLAAMHSRMQSKKLPNHCPTEYESMKACSPTKHFGEVLMWI